ncbi:MAG: NADH-quinone oxidoreductase subunit L [Gammaproteobacteria bacterium]|nr:MAG: NADH-quinone oxidoreductase subunit L [Gammaproteobacteria bacterium]
METVYLSIVIAPLLGALIAGLLHRQVGRRGAQWAALLGVGLSCVLSFYVLYRFVFLDQPDFNGNVYTWMAVDGYGFYVGFLVDHLTALMIAVVTFVSLMVHIYTIAYMADDPGYQRFFSYIALFTFSMLMLVMANNFLQLFFGWEAVGLVSYLLIGFWYKRPTAIAANLKAFIVNRVGDFGFLLGIAAVLAYFGTLSYAEVFAGAPIVAGETMEIIPGRPSGVITVICLLLFVGAMAKSAQIPLHVWLPDSMEGPTPISALIHAATMVTAGIFMVARMSPLFEFSETARVVVLVIGAMTASFMGLVGIVQNDIKRVIAYSTISQLGYMTVALGASAYAGAIFHLVTHAFFKALLFLAAGSVIIALHHEQDMRKMGGLRKLMPVTYWTFLIGALALIGFPGLSGYFSKDAIIEAAHLSNQHYSNAVYWTILSSVFVTALYTFRMVFMTFHGEPRMDDKILSHVRESPAVITVPLLMLAILSVIVGAIVAGPLLFERWFGDSIFVLAQNDVLTQMGLGWHGPLAFVLHAIRNPAFYFMLAGVFTAWVFYIWKPELPGVIAKRLSLFYRILVNKYGFDELYQNVIVRGSVGLGRFAWRYGDQALIDDGLVNGAARVVKQASASVRRIQTGYLFQYAFAMILGLVALLSVFVVWQVYGV